MYIEGLLCAKQTHRELAFWWETQKGEWVIKVWAEPQGTWEQLHGLPTLLREAEQSPLEEVMSKLTQEGQVNQVCGGGFRGTFKQKEQHAWWP